MLALLAFLGRQAALQELMMGFRLKDYQQQQVLDALSETNHNAPNVLSTSGKTSRAKS